MTQPTLPYEKPLSISLPAQWTFAAIVVAGAAWTLLLCFAVCSDIGVAAVGVPTHDWIINQLPRGPFSVDGFRDASLILLVSVLALTALGHAKREEPHVWLKIGALYLCGFGLLAWLVILVVHFVPPLPPSFHTLRLTF